MSDRGEITFEISGRDCAVLEAKAVEFLERFMAGAGIEGVTWTIDASPLTRNMGDEYPGLWRADVRARW